MSEAMDGDERVDEGGVLTTDDDGDEGPLDKGSGGESGEDDTGGERASEGESKAKTKADAEVEVDGAEPVATSGEKAQPEGAAVAPDGKRFKMPKTPGTYNLKWSGKVTLPFVVQWSTIIVHLILLTVISPWMSLLYFVVTRIAYNVGIGLMLRFQSDHQGLAQLYAKYLTTEDASSPNGTGRSPLPWVVSLLDMYHLDASEYDPRTAHPSLNSWLLFRACVDVILYSDVCGYVMFVINFFEVPESFSWMLFFSYVLGIVLCAFTWWAKSDAYRVVKDFAWYWGDFFFLLEQNLTFDRVFGMFPHPMYTVGYSFFYGLALICQSYTVLYASIWAHFMQLLFLVYAENPHIEKTYPTMCEDPTGEESRKKITSTYFRGDMLLFKNFNPFRSSDLLLCVMTIYMLMQSSFGLSESFYILQALCWRVVHTVGLGYILHRQSADGNFVRSYLERGCTKSEAFENWKRIYNFSLTITWTAFAMCGFMIREPNTGYSWQAYLTMHLFGMILLGLNAWTALSTYEVLGDFGWFYGDFFIEEAPKQLYYTGIYRYLNNPELYTGCAGYYGIALMSGSWKMFSLALISQALILLSHKYVELPHMRKLYGEKVRSKSGMLQELNSVVAEVVETSPETMELVRKLADFSEKAQQLGARAKAELEKVMDEANQALDRMDISLSPRTRKQKGE